MHSIEEYLRSKDFADDTSPQSKKRVEVEGPFDASTCLVDATPTPIGNSGGESGLYCFPPFKYKICQKLCWISLLPYLLILL